MSLKIWYKQLLLNNPRLKKSTGITFTSIGQVIQKFHDQWQNTLILLYIYKNKDIYFITIEPFLLNIHNNTNTQYVSLHSIFDYFELYHR